MGSYFLLLFDFLLYLCVIPNMIIMKNSKLFLILSAFCMSFLVGCGVDYEKMAKSYVAGQKVSYEDALLVTDGQENYVLHFEGIQSKKYTGRKLVKYYLDTEQVEKFSTISTVDGDIDLTKAKDWGCSKSSGLLYVVSAVGNEKCIYNISSYSLKGTPVCYGKDIEVLSSDIIQCRDRITSFYKWTGESLKTDRYTGKIGKSSVIMDIAFDGENIYGSYYYKSQGSSSQKSLRGVAKGMNFHFKTYNRKGVEQEEMTITHNGSELVGTCKDLKRYKTSNVNLSFSK